MLNDTKQYIEKELPNFSFEENELKSKAKYTFKNDLLKDITNELIKNKVGFYFYIS